MFYQTLRDRGFRAHVARNIYDQALALVKATKMNGGSKPVLRKLSARLDYQDARVELDKGLVKIILRDRWYTLRLRHRREYIERFKSLRWKEVHIKYENSRLYVSIVFEFRYKPYVPKGVIALDVNLRMVTAYDGSEVRRFRTRFVGALSKRRRAEELQSKYSKRWRYNEEILNKVKELHRKARNIVIDWCWKLAKQIALKALKNGYAIALEDLEGLRENMNSKSNGVAWKFTMFAYRRLQHSIISKALEHGVPVIIVDPRNTSSACPRCSEKLFYVHRLAVCKKCGFKGDRDSMGAMNIWFRALQAYAGVPGSPLRALAVKDETRQSGGTKHEGMKKVIRAIYS
jgi:putative transposase